MGLAHFKGTNNIMNNPKQATDKGKMGTARDRYAEQNTYPSFSLQVTEEWLKLSLRRMSSYANAD